MFQFCHLGLDVTRNCTIRPDDPESLP